MRGGVSHGGHDILYAGYRQSTARVPIMKNVERKKMRKDARVVRITPGTVGMRLLFDLVQAGSGAFDEMADRLGRHWAGQAQNMNAKRKGKANRSLNKASMRTLLWRLEQKGLVARQARRYEATSQGVRIVNALKEKSGEPRWDGKWRIVMFDIPEHKRHERNWLRYQLAVFEYRPLQKSVFIGKLPLEEEVYSWLVERKLDACVRLLTVGDIDIDLDDEGNVI